MLAENDPMSPFEEEARTAVKAALLAMGLDTELPMEIPPGEMGDFAFPCFGLAKEMRMAPAKIAEKLATHIPRSESFSKIEASGPYINFTIDHVRLAERSIGLILKTREIYGSFPPTGTRIILEHTSANPNNPLHVGRARNPIIGDTLARILRHRGHEVVTEFYVDDMGKQQVTLTWGVENMERIGQMLPDFEFPTNYPDKPDHGMVGVYQAAMTLSQDPRISKEIEDMISAYEGGDSEVAARVKANCQIVLEGMRQSLRRMDIHFDSFAWESKFVIGPEATVHDVVGGLADHPSTGYDDGALYLDLDDFGITGRENKFYLTRSDGTTLYSTRDVAYHINKLSRCDMAINVLGEDHKLKASVVNICLGLLGSDRGAEPLFYSFVKLPEGKMSTRRGQVVYLDDLMEEAVELALIEVRRKRPELAREIQHGIAETVGIGAIRYNIIRVQAEKPITFKWEDALNFEGMSAPFIQYAHARCSSILRKSETPPDYDTSLLAHPSEIRLIKALAMFPGQVKKCADYRACHQMATYAHEIAHLFNQFYRDCPVLAAENDALKNARLALVEATKWVIKDSLELLGITAPEEM